jgi:hypothetical protein
VFQDVLFHDAGILHWKIIAKNPLSYDISIPQRCPSRHAPSVSRAVGSLIIFDRSAPTETAFTLTLFFMHDKVLNHLQYLEKRRFAYNNRELAAATAIAETYFTLFAKA